MIKLMPRLFLALVEGVQLPSRQRIPLTTTQFTKWTSQPEDLLSLSTTKTSLDLREWTATHVMAPMLTVMPWQNCSGLWSLMLEFTTTRPGLRSEESQKIWQQLITALMMHSFSPSWHMVKKVWFMAPMVPWPSKILLQSLKIALLWLASQRCFSSKHARVRKI